MKPALCLTRFATALFATLLILPATLRADLRPWTENPWYWEMDGKPVLLLGGSDDDNLFQWPEARLIAQLDKIQAAGGNVIRNTMSDRKDLGHEVFPFLQLEDGRYDLEQWNPEYWDRLERLLVETERRSIVVQIEIWDRFDFTDSGESDRWQIHPYHPKNNINYTIRESGFASRYPDHPGANKQPFFFTTPEQRDNRVVRQYQERFVHQLLDHTLNYGHVLYCMDNETQADPAWGRYWARLVKDRARQTNRTVMTTEMWDDWNLTAERHKQTFDHPELYDFVDVSQNNQNGGQKHWDNFLYVRKYLSTQPRPMNTTKTYGADGNKFKHTDQDAIERFWRHLLAGAASIRFHRPPSGLGINEKAVACLKAARLLESIVPLWEINPANAHLLNRRENESYFAADSDRAYVLYLPAGETPGTATLNLSDAEGELDVLWINIDAGQKVPASSATITAGPRVTLRAPGRGNFVAALTPSVAP